MPVTHLGLLAVDEDGRAVCRVVGCCCCCSKIVDNLRIQGIYAERVLSEMEGCCVNQTRSARLPLAFSDVHKEGIFRRLTLQFTPK